MAPQADALVGRYGEHNSVSAALFALPAATRPSIDLVACASKAAEKMGKIKQLFTAALGWQVALSMHGPQSGSRQQKELEAHLGPGQRGAVASENGICTQIGIDLMQKGGNAADALVGTTLCVGVIGMYHSGIGGGG